MCGLETESCSKKYEKKKKENVFLHMMHDNDIGGSIFSLYWET